MTSLSSGTGAAAPDDQGSLLSVVLVLAIAALGAWYGLQRSASEAALVAEPPSLKLHGSTCSQQGEPAKRAAEQHLSDARSHWERAVFDSSLAPAAVRTARLSAACFLAAGLEERAHAADEVARGHEREVNEAYERERLRLKIALRRRDEESARAAIGRLRALLEHDDSEYLRGLARIERTLSAEESGQ